MILDDTEIRNTSFWWLPAMRSSGFVIYWLLIILFLSGLISLFFIHVDISTRANGIVRPATERTFIKAPVSGVIDSIYFKEGNIVTEGSLLLKFRDHSVSEKQRLNELDIIRYRGFIRDLERLLSTGLLSKTRISLLKTPLYKQEALRYLSKSEEQNIILAKANQEVLLNQKLASDKVISSKEFYDICVQQQKVFSASESFRQEQFADWQEKLVKSQTELKQCYLRREELKQFNESNQIRAPVSGTLQDLNGRYPGNSVQAGELICSLSPGGQLIGECYVSSRDVGLLRKGQPVRFQVDAFNYNYFGTCTGNIYSIDNDYVLIEKTPVFKVRCLLNEKMLATSNGYSGELKKGMVFQARFILSNRTLWQLVYDGLDDWLNPVRKPVLKNQ